MRRRRCTLPTLLLCSLLCFPVYAAQIQEEADHAFDSENAVLPKDDIRETEPETLLPSCYDSRDYGKTPAVRSQGELSTCWALTVTAALEAALMPEEHLEFSADHVSLNNGFRITQRDGGDYKIAMAYLSSWRGPVLEEEDPYGDGETVDGLSARVHVQEMKLLEGMSREQIKKMIMDCGPVQTSLHLDRSLTASGRDYYNEEQAAFYDPEREQNSHDVLLLGWDDGFPADNFLIRPEQDGAWICQNTWGTDFGDNGIFYVSYEDANIARGGVAYTKVEQADNYDRIYQTDVCGWQGRLGYDEDHCYFANVYEARENETLMAVGFYNTDANSEYEIYAVTDYQGTEDLKDRRISCGSVTLKEKGFYTIGLNSPPDLSKGERFAVIVSVRTEFAGRQAAVELVHDPYTQTVTLEGKEGYISLNGDQWEMAEQKYRTNICLKAYTECHVP